MPDLERFAPGSEQEALLVLNLLPGIGSVRYQALVAAFGSAAAALYQPEAALAAVRGFGSRTAHDLACWKERVSPACELALAEKSGVQIVTLADADYPEALRELADPPLALYYRGTLPDPARPAIAIVGSRRMSAYGRRMTRTLAEQAVDAGWSVISGLAFGVDGAAHEAALERGGYTAAVVAGGLFRITPQEHLPLARAIMAHNGAVISENPLEFPVNRQAFPRRNRIVAALTRAALVVEAGVDSGALITARMALDLGHSVFAVPGRAGEPQAAGCNALIRDGSAKLTERFQDVLDDFEFLPGFGPAAEKAASAAPEPYSVEPAPAVPAGLGERETAVLQAIRAEGTASTDRLLTMVGGAPGELTGVLIALELRGLVTREPDGRYSA